MSEIARMREQIELELVSMRSGLQGVAAGHARHAFIHARMDRVGDCQHVLADHLGEYAACEIVCQLYEKAMEQDVSYASTKI